MPKKKWLKANWLKSKGSLFGSGKLKELEQTNGKLQGEINKRDKQIRLLNEHMRMKEEHNSADGHLR